ncbi:transcription termination factor, mitochondrial [Lucilia sericata]|uniref:transcription termination factor, mitochondrial n=1 Tax=Lucilia sericata TaxID=13632 RepID=UPI0018A7E9AE|nr:transcription termination factor, mitochondrial [Lucilia sericata]
MWRNLLRSFERSLILNSKSVTLPNKTLNSSYYQKQIPQRFLQCSALLRNTETVCAVPSGGSEGDAEYIVPYRSEYEKRDNAKKLVETLRSRFRLSEEEVDHIMSDEIVLKTYRQKSLRDTMETLCMEGVTKKNFVEYPWLITLEKKRLSEKLKLLKSLNGFRDINDFVPFLRLQVPRLRKLVSALNREYNHVTHGNRVYFIAEQLNVPASIVTKYLAKRLFVLEMPLDMFKTNLQHMINYKVEPMNILKDLWGFRYAPRAVELRLRRALQAKKDKIMPWMVRCPEPILQKSLQLSLDELEVLGNKTSVAEYIGERLGFSAEEAQAIMDKHPQVNTVRVTKIKEVLDYLLDEAKFTRYEIAQVPRILCHSLETTKQRMEELKKFGCRPSSLVIVCRSKREYDKFLKQWQQSHNPNRASESESAQEDMEKV